jgi:alkanesulfonate monooxygenase SsuD/methylene tetrahydromethanopterin reductase-like flavin-dependent oxidoreductase (luciferase family)
MKFGLFYELQLPKPYDKDTWDPADEHRIVKEALEQIEFADALGFDYVFEVEHHFLEEYSHSSAPEVFLAAASQRTKNLRLGHGIVLTPPPFNHPARVAERIAMLDLVSNGRVEFGTGESSSDMELGGFGVDRAAKKAMWEEAVREIAKMMTDEPYCGFNGEYFKLPARNVIPKPLQKPHPPLWVAASRRETVMVAARMGLGSLGFAFETPEEAEERVAEYYRLVREECFPIAQAINPAVAIVSTFMCAQTDEEALMKAIFGAPFFAYSLNYYYVDAMTNPHPPGKKHLWRDFLATPMEEHMRRMDQRAAIPFSAGSSPTQQTGLAAEQEPKSETQRALWRAARRGATIGSPDFIRQSLKKYEDAHLDAMIMVAQCGMVKHEDIMTALELFGKEVMPEFKDRHAKHLEWRKEQLKGVDYPIHSSI